MAIRITQNQIASQFNMDVQSIYSRMARSQQQLSDGRAITKPSDDPFGTGQILGFDTQLADVNRYQENVADSIGFMNAADSALDSVTTALQAIREKALQAANGTNGMSDLQSIATEIQQLKEVVRDGMNAQHGDAYIFGGTATGAAPFPSPANAYIGTNNVMSRRVGQGQSVQINVPGDSVVGPNGANTLDIIDQLVIDIQTNTFAGIQAQTALIETQTNVALDVRTQLGARTARLEVLQGRLDLTEERLLAARSEVADVDSAEAYMEFTQQQTMYQAALAAGTRIMQTSILDFI
jgi:flagellar hook-associated protein 3 FlgL